MNFEKGILIASSNKAKIKEIKSIFQPLKINIYTLEELKFKELVVLEDGRTFKENAYKKAIAYATQYNILSLADDSGLEVDYLGGAPGIHSARYAGENSSSEQLISKLLFNLEGVTSTQRLARFKCMICLYDPATKENIFSEGVCEGSISLAPRGKNGFGYDPIFILAGSDSTMAELDEDEKNQLSHRFKALDSLKIAIEELFL